MGCGSNNPFGATLVDSLTPLADDLRSLYAEFGLRPYRVVLVWVGWGTGPADQEPVIREGMPPDQVIEAISNVDLDPDVVGVGVPTLLCELELSPRPLVESPSGVRKDQDSVGLTERGGLTVTQISARYSEDLLMGLVDPLRDPEKPDNFRPGIEFWWEIREERAAGFVAPGYMIDPAARQSLAPPRRRFHVSAVPKREPGNFQWVVSLNRADGERMRSGQLENL